MPVSPHMSTESLTFTVKELVAAPAQVIAAAQEAGLPVFITDHGRFVFLIYPLEPGQVESVVLAHMAQEIACKLGA